MLQSLVACIPLFLLIAFIIWYFKSRDKRPIKLPPLNVHGAQKNQRPAAAFKDAVRADSVLPTKRLTLLQGNCLHDAALGRLVVRDGDHQFYNHDGEYVLCADRTIDSLVKHGFLAANGRGAYVCTDLGRQAYEVLPVQG